MMSVAVESGDPYAPKAWRHRKTLWLHAQIVLVWRTLLLATKLFRYGRGGLTEPREENLIFFLGDFDIYIFICFLSQ